MVRLCILLLIEISCNYSCMTPVLMSKIDYCGYALVDTKSHASKYSKVTMSKLLGGVISMLATLVYVELC
jgi:hypothetical protein